MSEEKLSELLRGAIEPLSLETPIGEEGESRLADLIPAPDAHNPVAEATRGALRDELEAALDELTPREKEVIKLRYGLDGNEPRTLEEVGRELEVTRERVRQIEFLGARQAPQARQVPPPARTDELTRLSPGGQWGDNANPSRSN